MDRNGKIIVPAPAVMVSLSARRAWIEIPVHERNRLLPVVALRKESVDRNYPPGPPSFLFGASLSARRAWIEIDQPLG